MIVLDLFTCLSGRAICHWTTPAARLLSAGATASMAGREPCYAEQLFFLFQFINSMFIFMEMA